MKPFKLILPLCLVPCAALLIISGCGSGNGTTQSTPTVAASATPCSAAVTAASATIAGNANRITVNWTAPCGIAAEDIDQYHIFRDGRLVGTVTRTETTFTDGEKDEQRILFATASLVKSYPNTGLNLSQDQIDRLPVYQGVMSGGTIVPALTADAHQYRVTVLYKKLAFDQYEYAETAIGVSNSVTP